VTATLKYKKIYDDPFIGEVLRPIIPVEITKYLSSGGEVSEKHMVLIDSGADFCIFSGDFGELLGMDVKSGERYQFTGVGGKPLTGYIHRIGITVAPLPTINVDAVFSYELNDQNVGILGQRCFFDHYSVNFRYKQGEIVIKNR
jgi:hypothetical protein